MRHSFHLLNPIYILIKQYWHVSNVNYISTCITMYSLYSLKKLKMKRMSLINIFLLRIWNSCTPTDTTIELYVPGLYNNVRYGSCAFAFSPRPIRSSVSHSWVCSFCMFTAWKLSVTKLLEVHWRMGNGKSLKCIEFHSNFHTIVIR